MIVGKVFTDFGLPPEDAFALADSYSRVRLKNLTRPPDLKDMDKKIADLNKEKEEAMVAQNFEAAARFAFRAPPSLLQELLGPSRPIADLAQRRAAQVGLKRHETQYPPHQPLV